MTRRILFVKEGQIIERTLAQNETSDYVVTVQETLSDDWISRLSAHSFLVSASQLSQALGSLERAGLTLKGVEPRQLGSEQVYRELFEVN